MVCSYYGFVPLPLSATGTNLLNVTVTVSLVTVLRSSSGKIAKLLFRNCGVPLRQCPNFYGLILGLPALSCTLPTFPFPMPSGNPEHLWLPDRCRANVHDHHQRTGVGWPRN